MKPRQRRVAECPKPTGRTPPLLRTIGWFTWLAFPLKRSILSLSVLGRFIRES